MLSCHFLQTDLRYIRADVLGFNLYIEPKNISQCCLFRTRVIIQNNSEVCKKGMAAAVVCIVLLIKKIVYI